MAPSKTMITVAPTGAESAKSEVPSLPVTLDELVSSAKACEAAGAALIHIHIRDDDASPTLDLGRLRETVTAVREQTSLVVQLSTGGSVHDGYPATVAGARGRAGLVLADLWNCQLRRRRVHEPVAVHG